MFSLGGPIPEGVRLLLILNGAVFVIFHWLLGSSPGIRDWLALSSDGVLHGKIWQLGTYLFFHHNFTHLFFNMFYLFMFGGMVERAWGRRAFLQYYFVTGIGAGIVWTLVHLGSPIVTLGASGAIYALLLAFGVLFPNSTVLLFFIIPIRAKYLVAMLIGVELLYLMSTTQDGVAHLVHLAGAAIGYLYIRHGGGRFEFPSVVDKVRRWRMRRRLQVIDYRDLMKFHDADDRPGGKGKRGP